MIKSEKEILTSVNEELRLSIIILSKGGNPKLNLLKIRSIIATLISDDAIRKLKTSKKEK